MSATAKLFIKVFVGITLVGFIVALGVWAGRF